MIIKMNKFLLILLLSFMIQFPLFAESISLRVKLWNGSTESLGKADSIKVILLRDSMIPLYEQKGISGEFTIPKLDLPEGSPVLLQVSYKSANYNKMIPPVPAMRAQTQEVVVYEPTDNLALIKTRSLMQVVREKNSIHIFKIYLLRNETKPPKSIYAGGLDFYIPEEALDLQGSWTQGNSKMAIPLQFIKESSGKQRVDRAVLPGNTEVQISYRIPIESESFQFKDKLFFESKSGARPIFLKPTDMKVRFSSDANPERLQEDIPEGLQAFMVNYSKDSFETTIQMEGGTPVLPVIPNEARGIVNGSLIPEWDVALAAVIGFLGFFFVLALGFDAWKRKQKNDSEKIST
jgi:hypothetical protein